jgi:Integrase core domain.
VIGKTLITSTMEKEIIGMTQRELTRYRVIKNLIAKLINGTDAAKQLSLSVRQVKRLKARVIIGGAKGIPHKSRNRESNHRTDPELWQTAKDLIEAKYPDFGPTFAHEKLTEIHGLKIGEAAVRNLMIAEKIWTPEKRKKNKQYRCQRERKSSFGEMIQFDGCYHLWLEDRGKEYCLLSGIDDATGKPVKLEFADSESVLDVFAYWKEYIKQYGKPVAIYLDKYSTYKINHKSAKDNHELLTQFQRACKELDIGLITAHSPQAKGRVERPFFTFQDRLVKDMRLQNISTVEDANKFLKDFWTEDYGKRFGVAPKSKTDLHRKLSGKELANLDAIFSVQSIRQVKNDFTVQFKNCWYQLEKEQPVCVRRQEKILIEERLDGSLAIRLRGKYLNFKQLPAKPEKIKNAPFALPAKSKAHAPAANHPWRGKFAKLERCEKVFS